MAIVTNNMVLKGLSGMLGKALVFKTLRGKTIVAAKAKPITAPQSERQRRTRTKFKEATVFAKAAMADAERKSYYKNKAMKLNLPNAYTAALTDYMRKPTVAYHNHPREGVVVQVSKKGFNLRKVEVVITNHEGRVSTQRVAQKSGNIWLLNVDLENSGELSLLIDDVTGQHSVVLPLSHAHRLCR